MQRRLLAALSGAAIASAAAAGAEIPLVNVAAGVPLPLPAAPARPTLPDEPAAQFPEARGQPIRPVAFTAAPDLPAPGPGPRFGALGLPCEARLTAAGAPGGTVVLRIEAPCEAHSVAEIAHGPVAASFRLSSSGVAEAVFPAFTDRAAYTARLAGGTTLEADALVPGASGYERVVAMWQGDRPVAIHAFEYGAAPGEAGHVWHGAARAPAVAEAGRGGFLLVLGTAGGGRGAEVYSFPAADAARAGSVRMAFGAPVTEATCGRAFRATTLQIGADLPGAPVDIAWTMPACGADAPDDLMLKNLARDLKIAAQ